LSRQQLFLRVAAADVPRAELLLELAGAEALLLGDAGDDPVLEPPPDEAPLWPSVIVRAVFSQSVDLAPLCRVLRESCTPAEPIEIVPLDDAAWRDAVRQQFIPREIGARIWLAPPDAPAPTSDRVAVRLHMGLAFGTGEHPTTALCLEWLDARPPQGTVLDYGCGSGVLAIAALALGASHAWAVDHDAQAIAATAENARLNGVGDRLRVVSPEALPSIVADVIVANILAAPLEQLAPVLARHLRPRGSIALSGILESQVARVRAAYEPYFESFRSCVQHGWARLDGERRS
jgi:ribosomal protein L11 methyltransferase